VQIDDPDTKHSSILVSDKQECNDCLERLTLDYWIKSLFHVQVSLKQCFYCDSDNIILII